MFSPVITMNIYCLKFCRYERMMFLACKQTSICPQGINEVLLYYVVLQCTVLYHILVGRVLALNEPCQTVATSPHLLGAQDKRLGAEQNQLPCGSTGTSSGNCQETDTRMVRACHKPRQPLQNHPSGHLGGWATQRNG